ncbi:MAG: DUF1566 domain-containing protein [Proteobacteria bacterium]|nr:DUF1566 domain-containing protein [Pseudomonadota bacterium]
MKTQSFNLLVSLCSVVVLITACDEKSESETVVTPYSVICIEDTGLCWQDPQREAYNYDDIGLRAFEVDQYCDELVLGGFEDWRVPTIGELRSITEGFPGTETGGSCPIVDGDITYAQSQNFDCFNDDYTTYHNATGDNGCFLVPDLTGTCDKGDPYSGGHPLEHVALETPSDTEDWRATLMFENGSVVFNHACTGVDVRCVRDDDGSPVVDCVESQSCIAGETKSCACEGFGDRPDGIQTCNDAGDCWGPCECTKSIVDISADPECHAGNEAYDQADILKVNVSLPEGATIDYEPEVFQIFLYECPDDNTTMPRRPPDGGSWENQMIDPGPPPYDVEVRGITYYREEQITGRFCLLAQMSQKNVIPPIPQTDDYLYWDASVEFVFPLAESPQEVNITLRRIGL